MDEYGSFRDLESDYVELAALLLEKVPLTFAWSCDQQTAYIVTICRPHVLGTTPFGGRADFMVSVLLTGSYWIELLSDRILTGGYLAEKFRCSETTGTQLAILLNGLRHACLSLKRSND